MLTCSALQFVVGIVALGVVTWRARRRDGAKADAPAWVLCWTSLATFVIADGFESSEVLHWRLTGTALDLVASSLAFGALYRLFEPHTSTLHRVRQATEAVLVAGALTVASWVAFLGDIVASSKLGAIETVVLVATTVAAAAVAAYALQVVLTSPPGGRFAVSCLAGAAVSLFVGETLVAVERMQHGPSERFRPVDLALSLLGFVLVAVAATRRTTTPSATVPGPNTPERSLRWALWLVPSSLAIGLSVFRLRPGVADHTLLTMAGLLGAFHLLHLWFLFVENGERLPVVADQPSGQERYYRRLFEHSTDVVAVVGPDHAFREHTPSLVTVLGWQPEDLLESRVDEFLHEHGAADALRSYRRIVEEHSPSEVVTDRLLHADGTWRDVEFHFANHLEDPAVQGVVATMRDITDRRRLEGELLHQAFHDPLTGLANRALFRSTLERSVESAVTDRESVAVLLLDLDGFKAVNDTFGHSTGDQVLRVFAERMRGVVRAEDTLARLGGDEFAILVGKGGDPAAIAERVAAILSKPLAVDGKRLELSASVGIADTRDASTVDELLRNADMAMYAAKQDPESATARFDPSISERTERRDDLLVEIRRAIEREEFVVWLQPIVNLADGMAKGFEALVRWAHPTRGIVYPGDFVPLAEESGLIDAIGDMVLRRAVTEAAPALKENGWYLSVNVSTRQLDSTQLLLTTQELLRSTGLPPHQLVLEITESAVMSNPETALLRLERLSRLGVRIALDDFGTGYSSLGVLSKFPFKVLKVDRTFVRALHEDAASAGALLRAIDEIGRALDLTIVAEGIETEDERQALVRLGYKLAQGYLFSKAVPPAEAIRLAATSFAPAVPAPV